MPKPPAKPKNGKAQASDSRAPTYDSIKVEKCTGDKAMTAETAKILIGWEEVETRDSSCVSELTAITGLYVRLHKNLNNRYLTPGWLLTLRQEHLNRRWRFNGETVVIGEYGNVQSGQHRLLSLILAELERAKTKHWQKKWPDQVTMETLVVYGVKEDDDTFKTLNCNKPGTLAEILYRSEWFASSPPDERKSLARLTDGAIKLLWARTGAKEDAYAPRRTHGEALDFLGRHPTVIKCVRHVFEENQPRKDAEGTQLAPGIGSVLAPGAAAGLMYLMASSASDPAKYTKKKDESVLDFERFDKASDFWALLAGRNPDFDQLHYAISALADPDSLAGARLVEKAGVLCKGWAAFLAGEEFSQDALELKYHLDEADHKIFDEDPTTGGIDLGGELLDKDDDEEDADDEDEPAPAKPSQPVVERVGRESVNSDQEAKSEGEPAHKAVTKVLKNGAADELAAIKSKHKDALLLFHSANPPFKFTAWGDDAVTVAKALGIKTSKNGELPSVQFFADRWEQNLAKLLEAGHKVCRVEKVGEAYEVEPAAPPKPKKVKKVKDAEPVTA